MANETARLPVLYKHTAKEGTQEWEIWVTRVQGDLGCINVRHGLSGGKMQVSQEVISVGKNAGRKNATTPYAQAVAEARSRWEVKLNRKGYGLTPGESQAVRSVSPMLAHTYDKQAKKVDWGTAFAQPKLDGFRCLVRIGPDGEVTMTSRENQPFDALADMRGLIADVAKGVSVRGSDAEEVVLDGELYCHGMSLNEISSACKRKSEKTKKLQYHVYDAMMGSADFKTRSLFAKDFVEAAADDALRSVETVKVRSEADLMVCQQDFINQGFEGAMLRHGSAPYQAGKRSANLLKVKTFLDAEFEVVDFKMGRGKYAGVPVFVCQTEEGHTFDVTAPGTMEEKKGFGAKAKSFVGKMLTVKYIYFTKTEEPVPFLPVALRFRDV